MSDYFGPVSVPVPLSKWELQVCKSALNYFTIFCADSDDATDRQYFETTDVLIAHLQQFIENFDELVAMQDTIWRSGL